MREKRVRGASSVGKEGVKVVLYFLADSIASIPISKTKNNYASVDCGAKVTGTNHEARVSHVTVQEFSS